MKRKTFRILLGFCLFAGTTVALGCSSELFRPRNGEWFYNFKGQVDHLLGCDFEAPNESTKDHFGMRLTFKIIRDDKNLLIIGIKSIEYQTVLFLFVDRTKASGDTHIAACTDDGSLEAYFYRLMAPGELYHGVNYEEWLKFTRDSSGQRRLTGIPLTGRCQINWGLTHENIESVSVQLQTTDAMPIYSKWFETELKRTIFYANLGSRKPDSTDLARIEIYTKCLKLEPTQPAAINGTFFGKWSRPGMGLL